MNHIICRCEDVSAADIATAITAGATTAQEIKFQTRAGMGFCQGRVCRPAIDAEFEHCGITPDAENGPMTVRLPVRPTSLADLADYEDGN